jgi:response regulator RpfG family c-di-GMP phosphodiesterase
MFDIVLTGVKLTDGDGIDFISQIRKRNEKCRCIVLTDFYLPVLTKRIIDNGSSDIIYKPINPLLLKLKIERALSSRTIEDNFHVLSDSIYRLENMLKNFYRFIEELIDEWRRNAEGGAQDPFIYPAEVLEYVTRVVSEISHTEEICSIFSKIAERRHQTFTGGDSGRRAETDRRGGEFVEISSRMFKEFVPYVLDILHISKQNIQLRNDYRNLLIILVEQMESRSPFLSGHSSRVAELSNAIARRMGVVARNVDLVEESSYIHDLGNLMIDERIFRKVEIDPDDLIEIKKHPLYCEHIVGDIRFFDTHKRIVRSHHERYDGRGYPDGIGKEEIPLPSRILSLAESYDAMTSPRPFRKPMSFEEARREVQRNRDTQFDPFVVDAFFAIPPDELSPDITCLVL